MLVSVVTSCFNEESNLQEFIDRTIVCLKNINCDFELIISDNASTDNSLAILRDNAEKEKRIKVIINNNNYGPHRSPVYGFYQASGDAVIMLASDLQDPPELIPHFVERWLNGEPVVLGTYKNRTDGFFKKCLRAIFYNLLIKLSDIKILKNATGFGIYDRKVVDLIKNINDPRPFPRGLVCELGFDIGTISFEKPGRKGGVSKSNISELYSTAVLGFTSHSVIPLRFIGIVGLLISLTSFMVAFVYLVMKLIFWETFEFGMAPLVIGGSFMFGILSLFLGIIGEYLASIHTYVRRRPLVVEEDRINF
tara:strand:+ start:3136 stop:4059 length:924 start_codon:yes stop_codon:yes gene_type:complete